MEGEGESGVVGQVGGVASSGQLARGRWKRRPGCQGTPRSGRSQRSRPSQPAVFQASMSRMERVNRKALAAALGIGLALAGCLPPGQTPTPTAVAPTLAADWPTYTNEAFGFAIDHPPDFEVPGAGHAEPFGNLGEQITFSIGEVSPEDCRGDCPVIESSEAVQVAGQPATKLAGYIGSIGGNIPQQYQTYVFEREGRFYSFTLYALERSETVEGTDIQPLAAEDVALFEQMLATLRFVE